MSEREHVANRRSNWRRVFCWWWGHEYVGVVAIWPDAAPGLACLRCFGANFTPPTTDRPADGDLGEGEEG